MMTAALLLGCALSGCVTAKKYKMVKKEAARPPAALNWTAGADTADLTLQSVIVFKGPGSWKREARWDEYVVTISNRGTEPLAIQAAVLVDLFDAPREWGVDPWQLEKMSYTNWDKYGKTGLKLAAGAGVVVIYGAALTTVSLGAGLTAGAGTAATAGATAGTVILLLPVVAVVDITAVAIMNNQNKKKVVAEFNRRRLPVPQVIAPGQTVSGSYFFPMTPGPKKLFLRGKQAGEPVELVIDLGPLAGLHLKPAPEKKTTPP
jgi:hypothetical protein